MIRMQDDEFVRVAGPALWGKPADAFAGAEKEINARLERDLVAASADHT
ncbi:hypothetical protein [Variovorax sp. YR216]|nr:hypothetical protein [Variovorax sp. YR216]